MPLEVECSHLRAWRQVVCMITTQFMVRHPKQTACSVQSVAQTMTPMLAHLVLRVMLVDTRMSMEQLASALVSVALGTTL